MRFSKALSALFGLLACISLASAGTLPLLSAGGSGTGAPSISPYPAASFPAAPYIFLATVRLDSYAANGPIFDIVCVTGGATATINFVANIPDMATVASTCPVGFIEISKWYDQSGNAFDCTASSNRPALSTLNNVNGIQAVSFDGSNGIPLITRQCALPSGVVLDIANLAYGIVGRQTASGGNQSSMITLSSVVPATIADWRNFGGLSYVATSTQTNAIYLPTNPASFALSRGATSGNVGGTLAGQNYLYAERNTFRGGASATTGTGTSVGGIVGNTITGTSRMFAEVVAFVATNGELTNTQAHTLQTVLESVFPTPIQSAFADTIVLQGDSIMLGTGTTYNQNATRQIWPLLKRPTRMINAGVFGAVVSSLVPLGSAGFNIFGGWTAANGITYVIQSGTNDFAISNGNQGMAGYPTIATGGATCAASSTFNITTTGGAIVGGAQAIISVTTNGAGVITTINNVVNFGSWSVTPTSPVAVTGSTCVGATINTTFIGINTATYVAANVKQLIVNAKAAGITRIGIQTILPRGTWIGTPQPWVEAQAYNLDVTNNGTTAAGPLGTGGFGATFTIPMAADPTLGNINNYSGCPCTITVDGLHLNNAGWAIGATVYQTALNAALPFRRPANDNRRPIGARHRRKNHNMRQAA